MKFSVLHRKEVLDLFVINNVLSLLEKKKLKQADLCEAIGINSSTMTNWKNRGTDPPAKYIIPICEFLKVSPYLLLTGTEAQEPVIHHNEEQHIKKYRILDEHGKQLVDTVLDIEVKRCEAVQNRPSFTFRRLSENKVSAGAGFDLNDPDQWETIEVIDTPEARRADFAVEVEGESMEPDYHNGDIVYISLASEVPVGQVGLFIQNGKGYIKEAGNGRIISRNPKYDDIFPEDGDIECKGRVIGIAELTVR